MITVRCKAYEKNEAWGRVGLKISYVTFSLSLSLLFHEAGASYFLVFFCIIIINVCSDNRLLFIAVCLLRVKLLWPEFEVFSIFFFEIHEKMYAIAKLLIPYVKFLSKQNESQIFLIISEEIILRILKIQSLLILKIKEEIKLIKILEIVFIDPKFVIANLKKC